jgi:hypothetical protein
VNNLKEINLPDITPAQIASAVILGLTNILILFGLSISPGKEAALSTLINGAAVVGFVVAEAIRSHGRAKIAAAAVTKGEARLK